MPKSNRLREAFKENYNTIGLASAVGLSAALLNPLPLIAGIVVEAAYLLFVPDSKWYEARLARRFDAEIEQRRQKLKAQTLPQLKPEMQERFQRLEEMRRQIDAQSQDNKAWFREVLRKLDYLLEKFLLFASKEVQFRSYLESLRREIRGERQNAPYPSSGDNRHPARGSEDLPRRATHTSGSNGQASGGANDSWAQQAVEEIQDYYAREQERLEELLKSE